MLEKGVEGVPSLKRMGYIFVLCGQGLQLFALANLVATTPGVGAMEIIAMLCYFAASLLTLLLWILPEFRDKKIPTIVASVLCLAAALFILLGLIIHGAEIAPYLIGTTVSAPYYSTTLIVCSAVFAVGGAICLLLELRGFALTWTPPKPQRADVENDKNSVKVTKNKQDMGSVRGQIKDEDIRPDFRESREYRESRAAIEPRAEKPITAFNFTYFEEEA